MSDEKRYLSDYQPGDTFTDFFVIRSKDLRTKRDGEPYLVLEFGDRSGRLFGHIWNDADRIFSELEVGCIVKLQGRIEVYRDSVQVGVKKLRRTTPEDEVDDSRFIAVSSLDPKDGLDSLRKIVSSFSNTSLKSLLSEIINDEEIASGLVRAPGGKLWHHNRIGGLVEHTLGVVQICRFVCRMNSEVDRDLLISGAILHDIGKIEEYQIDTLIDFTDRGRLVGHVTIGAQLISEFADSLDDFPPDLLDRLTHLVLSHQAEFGSPVQPATPEAFILHYADQIDSKLDAFRRIGNDLKAGERWKFVRLLDRYIDFGELGASED